MLTRRVRLGWALSALVPLTGCGLSLQTRPATRLDVVTTPGAMDLCLLSVWMLPEKVSADQAAELAVAARTEGKECAERHRALVEDVKRHNERK